MIGSNRADGYRALAFKDGKDVRLVSLSGNQSMVIWEYLPSLAAVAIATFSHWKTMSGRHASLLRFHPSGSL
jgi:hypothetical protein